LVSYIRNIPYFCDGAVSQYKNRKNSAKLVNHKDDFGITEECHFFANSQGKSPCDAVCGTGKHKAATVASLQTSLWQANTDTQRLLWICKWRHSWNKIFLCQKVIREIETQIKNVSVTVLRFQTPEKTNAAHH
jgi:hypothetical protein